MITLADRERNAQCCYIVVIGCEPAATTDSSRCFFVCVGPLFGITTRQVCGNPSQNLHYSKINSYYDCAAECVGGSSWYELVFVVD